MESKLPKPSGLKRPTPVSILPMDRIKSAAPAFGSRNTHAIGGPVVATGSSTSAAVPLSKDILNMPNPRNVRAGSPELSRVNTMAARAKLRRSRSACDIREMRPNLKRAEPTLAPIPSKAPRLMSTYNNNNTTLPAFRSNRPFGGCPAGQTATASFNQKPTLGSTSSMAATTKTGPRTAVMPSSRPAGTTNPAGIKKPTTGVSVSTTGAGKPINKRIPPYDYKARYNDLLDKYKVIKEKLDEKTEVIGSYESLPEQLEESQAKLFATHDQLDKVQKECVCLQGQVQSQAMKIDMITACLTKTKDELEQLTKAHEIITTEHGELSAEVVDLRSRCATLDARNHFLEEEMIACKDQLFRSNMERRDLHNTVLDLRGNIRVFCRVRPPLECEGDKMLCGWNYLDEATVEIQNPDLVANKNKTSAHTFNFDYVFHPRSLQEDIFEMVSPLIQSALDGYNICIFAYGQTGSGKTYTMDGVAAEPGVIPRTVDLLFDSVLNYKRLGWEYEIKVTFLEIYNEVLYDLLSNDQKEMDIRMAKGGSRNDVYVSNITQETVTTAARLRQLMNVAKMNRATAATTGNERSSRSHAVTKIELIGHHEAKNETSIGTINLVDLAGSESPKTSIRMAETKNINRSLSELTNVILALLQKQDHIPYRNSKLTHLLMPSLGGNSKTLMFINVAPFIDCFVESVKSLRFAASVNSCKMTKARRNRFLNTSIGSTSVDRL